LKATTRYTFGRDEKLKSPKAVEMLFKDGEAFSIFPLRIVYSFKENNLHCVKAGVSVSAKNFKKAIDRNRIKRLMREAYRLQKNSLTAAVKKSGKQLSVFFIYTGNELPEYKLIFEKMKKALYRLQTLNNENSNGNT
jgi:ribonuclease P protein component